MTDKSTSHKLSYARAQTRHHTHVVWAMLLVSKQSEREIHEFFARHLQVSRRYLKRKMHLSIYHARRPFVGLKDYDEEINIVVHSEDLRFMVMAPGGENPRPDIDPVASPIGVRLKRGATATKEVLLLRERFYKFETRKVLGSRAPSSHTRNAFGARYYQPHITLLNSYSGIGSDLKPIADRFRLAIKDIHFDRLIVRCRSRTKVVVNEPFSEVE